MALNLQEFTLRDLFFQEPGKIRCVNESCAKWTLASEVLCQECGTKVQKYDSVGQCIYFINEGSLEKVNRKPLGLADAAAESSLSKEAQARITFYQKRSEKLFQALSDDFALAQVFEDSLLCGGIRERVMKDALRSFYYGNEACIKEAELKPAMRWESWKNLLEDAEKFAHHPLLQEYAAILRFRLFGEWKTEKWANWLQRMGAGNGQYGSESEIAESLKHPFCQEVILALALPQRMLEAQDGSRNRLHELVSWDKVRGAIESLRRMKNPIGVTASLITLIGLRSEEKTEDEGIVKACIESGNPWLELSALCRKVRPHKPMSVVISPALLERLNSHDREFNSGLTKIICAEYGINVGSAQVNGSSSQNGAASKLNDLVRNGNFDIAIRAFENQSFEGFGQTEINEILDLWKSPSLNGDYRDRFLSKITQERKLAKELRSQLAQSLLWGGEFEVVEPVSVSAIISWSLDSVDGSFDSNALKAFFPEEKRLLNATNPQWTRNLLCDRALPKARDPETISARAFKFGHILGEVYRQLNNLIRSKMRDGIYLGDLRITRGAIDDLMDIFDLLFEHNRSAANSRSFPEYSLWKEWWLAMICRFQDEADYRHLVHWVFKAGKYSWWNAFVPQALGLLSELNEPSHDNSQGPKPKYALGQCQRLFFDPTTLQKYFGNLGNFHQDFVRSLKRQEIIHFESGYGFAKWLQAFANFYNADPITKKPDFAPFQSDEVASTALLKDLFLFLMAPESAENLKNPIATMIRRILPFTAKWEDRIFVMVDDALAGKIPDNVIEFIAPLLLDYGPFVTNKTELRFKVLEAMAEREKVTSEWRPYFQELSERLKIAS